MFHPVPAVSRTIPWKRLCLLSTSIVALTMADAAGVTAQSYPVVVQAGQTLTNSSSQTATNVSVYQLQATGTLVNQAGATLQTVGTTAGTVVTTGVNGATITNSGTIANTAGGPAISVAGESTINNLAGGLITSNANAIEVRTSGAAGTTTINNAGTISSTGGTGFAAIKIGDGTGRSDVKINNQAGGTITSTGIGINVTSGVSSSNITITNAAGAVIESTGSDPAIRVSGQMTGGIDNAGTIRATKAGATAIEIGTQGGITAGVTAPDGGTYGIVNRSTGVISSNGGLAIDNQSQTTALKIYNAGSIVGHIQMGFMADELKVAGGSIQGDIRGRAVSGQTVNFDLGSGARFTTQGTINNVANVNVTSGIVRLNNDILMSGSTAADGVTVVNRTLNVSNAGTIEVNRAAGTRTIQGNYSQTGSLTSIFSDTNVTTPTSGMLAVTGTTTLGSAAQFKVDTTNLTKPVTVGTAYTVLTAGSGGLTAGAIASSQNLSDDGSAVLKWSATATGNTVTVAASVDTDPTTGALTNLRGNSAYGTVATAFTNVVNNYSTLTAINSDSTGISQRIVAAVTGRTSKDQVLNDLRTLAPNQVTGRGRIASSMDVAGRVANVVSGRLQLAFNDERSGVSSGQQVGKIAVWARGFGSSTTRDATSTYEGYNSTIWGLMAGGDMKIGSSDFRVGAGLGYSWNKLSSRGAPAASSADVGTFHGVIYGGYDNGTWYADAQVGMGLATNETKRATTAAPNTATAKFDSQQYQVRIGGGYRIAAGEGFEVTPNAFLQHTWLRSDAYRETGLGAMSLSVNSQSDDATVGAIGVRVARNFVIDKGVLTPELRLGYLHNWASASNSTASWVGAPGSMFSIGGPNLSEGNLMAGAGVTFLGSQSFSLTGNYDYVGNGNLNNHQGTIQVKVGF